MRFDVVAIGEVPGESPIVRLHKAAFLSTDVNATPRKASESARTC